MTLTIGNVGTRYVMVLFRTFVDPNSPVIGKNHAVGTSGDLYRPTVNVDLDLCRDLARKPGFGDFELALDPAVKLSADPKAGKAGPGEADGALFGLAEEVADSGPNRPQFCVDDDGHSCPRLRRVK